MSDLNSTVDPTSPVVVQNFENTALEGAIEMLPQIVEESKAGWKSTEFWVTVVIALLTVLDGVPLPEKYEAVVVGVLGAAYAISRGLAKKGVPNITPVSD